MHARVVRLKTDPLRLEEGTSGWKQNVLPIIKQQAGFRGTSLMANRESGEGLAVSYWESEAAMKAAREQVRPHALKNLEAGGGSIVDDTETEVLLMERFQPPKAGTFVRVTTVQGDVARLDAGVAHFREKVLPVVKGQKGARAGIFLANRASGKAFAASIWDSEADLHNSSSAVAGLRDEGIRAGGGTNPSTEVFEVIHTDIPERAGASA